MQAGVVRYVFVEKVSWVVDCVSAIIESLFIKPIGYCFSVKPLSGYEL